MNATVGSLLAEAAGAQPGSRREAQLLLGHVLQRSLAWLVAHDRDEVDETQSRAFRDFARRRREGEPIAYLVGVREFHGLAMRVTPDVLIPRPETETLVDAAVDILRGRHAATVLDLGTGSGCIAVSIAHERPEARVTAIDASAAALGIARENARAHACEIEFLRGDWLEPVAGRRFHLIASNPPYVADGDPHLCEGDLRFEPAAALVAGKDGLDAIRAIVRQAPAHLHPGGWLLIEHGYDQAGACKDLLFIAGFGDLRSIRDLAGIARVAGGRLMAQN